MQGFPDDKCTTEGCKKLHSKKAGCIKAGGKAHVVSPKETKIKIVKTKPMLRKCLNPRYIPKNLEAETGNHEIKRIMEILQPICSYRWDLGDLFTLQ